MKATRIACTLVLVLFLAACSKARSDSSSSTETQAPPVANPQTTEIGLTQPQIDGAMDAALKIDPERSWEYLQQFVAIGSRPLGSPGHKKAEDYIHAHLKGDEVEDDAFTQQT